MAGKEIRAQIVLGGRTDSSFAQIGDALSQLGGQVNRISRRLIDFGKESVETYTDYEDAMLDAQVALSTQYTTTSELGKVMDQLDKSAMQWASSSRFTTDDVAGAISNAAHAGWDLEEILMGVPNAMNISLAGGMDLATGLEYLVDITNASGISFERLGELTDYWAYAANSSSTTIPEMGQAMQKMGSTMQFVKGDMAGLTTMLAVLADNGTKGTEAGTLLRNSMIRLIAPTKKAAEAMDSLELSEADLEDVYSDTEGLESAVALLKEAGFNAYDSKGNLKSFLTIFEDLNKATAGMTEEERNNVLSAIFPTRTITGALALLKAASDGWDGLYESIQNNGEGYAGYARDTMESGLGGTLRQLEAAWDVLENKTGKELADPVETVATALTGLINAVNGMDEDMFSAVVSGLEVVAGAGPALLIAGGAIKAISTLGVAGGLGLAAISLAAFVAAMADLDQSIYEDKFGNLELDEGTINAYLSGLGSAFASAQADIDKYNTAVETAVSDYTTASGTFKDSLLTKMLTGATLTDTDIQTLNGLGDQMRDALIAGIDGSYSAAEETVALFAGSDAVTVAEDEDSIWGSVMDTLNYGYETAIAQAEQLGQNLRDAMTAAFDDGKLTSEEIDNIQSIINQQNELLAMQTDAQNAVERQKLLRQAQTLGLEGMEQISQAAQTRRDAELAAAEDDYWNAYYQTQLGGRMKIRDGVKKADGSLYTQDDLDAELAYLYSGDADNPNDGYLGQKQGIEADFDRYLLDLYNSTVNGSELKDVWDGLGQMADSFLATGTLTDEALRNYQNGFDFSDRDYVSRYIDSMIDALGGYGNVQERADYYAANGDLESANRFSRLLAMYELAYAKTSGSAKGEDQPHPYGDYTLQDAQTQSAALSNEDPMTTLAWEKMREAWENGYDDPLTGFSYLMSGNVGDSGFQSGIDSIVARLGEIYDLSTIEVPKGLEGIHDYAAAWKLLFGGQGSGTEETPEGTGETKTDTPKQSQSDEATYSAADARAQSEALNSRDSMTENVWAAMRDAMSSGYDDPLSGVGFLMSENLTDLGYRSGIKEIVDQLGQVYDLSAVEIPKGLESIRDYAAAWQLMFGEGVNPEDYRIKVTPEVDPGEVSEQIGSVPIDIKPKTEDGGLSDLENQGVEVAVTGDTTELTATIDGEDGQTLMEYISGDATDLSLTISDQDGKTLIENVTGDANALANVISSYNGRTITVNIRGNRLFADGGRATEPSTFGEAGPEWAIPEEHSERTAQLFDAAVRASGFTYDELLSRNGGLNAGGGGNRTLVYSPTIYANDATGVEDKLGEDKKRLEKMLQEREMRDDVEVYA